MGWVGLKHTMRYHAHYHTRGLGHVYQQRTKSFPIQDDDHFFVVCRYVERNALRAGLVARAEDWQWSSQGLWLQSSEPAPKLLSKLMSNIEKAFDTQIAIMNKQIERQIPVL